MRMLYAMALTSTDGWQRRLGKWWRRLHSVGIYYLWFIFTASYAGRALGDDPGKRVVGLFFGGHPDRGACAAPVAATSPCGIDDDGIGWMVDLPGGRTGGAVGPPGEVLE